MTTGAAYDLAQSIGWKATLHSTARNAPGFYTVIGAVTALSVALNFLGFNPMKALVWAGVVQGFSTPPLLLLIMLMTNDRRIMGDRVNGLGANVLGWITTAAIFLASLDLIASLFV
jgi:Mn2+/Fe2+ NRAMP family transporter